MRHRVIWGALLSLVVACSDDGPAAVRPTTVDSSSTTVAEDGGRSTMAPGQVVAISGLDNVSTIVAAFGVVWAVTANRPDEFSPGEVRSTIVRIDPRTLQTEPVVEVEGVEAKVVAVGDRLWVASADAVVALNGDGDEVGRVSVGRPIGVAAAGGSLWVVDAEHERLLEIDPLRAEIASSTETGAFPTGPVSAFGHVWVLDLIDGTVMRVEGGADAASRGVVEFVTEDPKSVLPMDGLGEVWITDIDGAMVAVPVPRARGGSVRPVDVGRPINSAVVHERTAFLLPTWGTSVFAFDTATGTVVAEIPIGSIPVRALVAHDLVWVTGDGIRETLTVIDPASLTVQATFDVGTNESTTTGPRVPIVVGDEIWVPNRGDDAIFIVDADEL